MNRKDNRRTAMTKHLLKESLLELLETQDIHKISIRALCQRADLNRSTFYKHYASQYDLLKDMEDDLLAQIDKSLRVSDGSPASDLDQLADILSFIQAHLRLCRVLIHSNTDPDFPKRLLHHPAILQKLRGRFPEGGSPAQLAYLQDFFLYGGYQLIQSWILSGCRESPAQIAQILTDIQRRLS